MLDTNLAFLAMHPAVARERPRQKERAVAGGGVRSLR